MDLLDEQTASTLRRNLSLSLVKQDFGEDFSFKVMSHSLHVEKIGAIISVDCSISPPSKTFLP